MPLLSIVVPVYNEEGNVRPLYERVLKALQPISDRYDLEFIFTDNCSSDTTFQRLLEIAQGDNRVRVFRFTRNFGFQRSILSGYRLAGGDAAVQIDCDLQDPPELICEFVKLWELGYKVVYGIRSKRPEPALLQTSRKVFYRLLAWLSHDELPVDAGDFRLVDRSVLELLHCYNDENPYIRGYIASIGFRQLGVRYERAARERGKSGFRFSNLVNLALDGVISHSILPLRLASFVGGLLAMASCLTVAVYAALWLIRSDDWPAGFATVSILILLSLAINSIFLGIIGEYLARIYKQVKPQPLTIVDQFVDPRMPEDSERRTTRRVAGMILPNIAENKPSPTGRSDHAL